MVKEFNSLEEIEKYYDEGTNTYEFIEDDEMIDLVIFNFYLNVEANIKALNINSKDIKTWNIEANNIKFRNVEACNIKANYIIARNVEAINIEAEDISYYAVCFAYQNISCKSIKARSDNAKQFVLESKLEIKGA